VCVKVLKYINNEMLFEDGTFNAARITSLHFSSRNLGKFMIRHFRYSVLRHSIRSSQFMLMFLVITLKDSYIATKKMHLLSQIIYSWKTPYTFRTAFPSIIRSSKLRIQQRYMSNTCCYLLLSDMIWNGVPSHLN